MRIGIVTYDYDPPIGGLGVVAKQTRLTLSTLFPGDSHVVLSPSPHADERVNLLAALWWRKPGSCPLFSLLLWPRLDSLIRKYELDLLHLHAGSGGVFLLQKPSCPLVVTAHHTYLQEAEIVFLHHPIKRWWKRLMASLERRTYDVADEIVCVSYDTALCLVERYGQPMSKITVIENGVRDVADVPFGKKEEATILCIGRVEERKGVWVFLKAASQLRRTHPALRIRLVGRDVSRGKLRRVLEDEGLVDCVTVTGHIDDPLMVRELAQATVLVVPSLLEGFGLIAAQGMLAGTCVVCSDAPGLRSIVKDDETGLVFKSGDPTDCARAIKEALYHPDLRLRLEQAAKVDALKRFSLEDRTRDLHRVFERVLVSFLGS